MAERRLEDWLTSYIEYTDNSEPASIYRWWVGISTIAAVLQRKCFTQWDSKIYPNMYVVLVGPSGRSRKGTAMRQGLYFLNQKGVVLAAEATTREALIKQLRRANDSDISPEGGLQLHCSLTIFSQELVVFLGYDNKQLMYDLTDWYDCGDKWTYETKGAGTDNIVNVWVNLIGAITPSLIQSSMPLQAIGGGLTSRMVFVYAEKRGKIISFPMPTPEEIKLRDVLSIDLESISMLRGEFVPDTGFLELYDPWYQSEDKDCSISDSRFDHYIDRRSTHLRKLTMVLNASRTDSMLLEAQDFKRALDMMRFVEKYMNKSFGGAGRADLSDLVYGVSTIVIERGEILRSELMRIFRYDADSGDMARVIETLVESSEISVSRVENSTEILIKFIGGKHGM